MNQCTPPGCTRGLWYLSEAMRRDIPLKTAETYHIFNKSIAGFVIFNNDDEFLRMKKVIRYYQLENPPVRFARFLESKEVEEHGFNEHFISISSGRKKLVQVIAYCIMPTHLHLILKQLEDNGVSIFMGNVLNSYARYFNLKHKRKGPLWEGKFKNGLIESDQQLLHLTRYLHLNPTSAGIADRPKDWIYSSYSEYLGKVEKEKTVCCYESILDISPSSYKKFVEDRISYQRELEKIKHLILE